MSDFEYTMIGVVIALGVIVGGTWTGMRILRGLRDLILKIFKKNKKQTELYLVFGWDANDSGVSEFKYLYGVFSSFMKANQIATELELRSADKNGKEIYGVEKHTLDSPTAIYWTSMH